MNKILIILMVMTGLLICLGIIFYYLGFDKMISGETE